MKFRVGVIGATGYIGTPYRREIREAANDGQIVALCARRRDRLESAAAEDDCEFITDDWRQVVESTDVDLVVVATPDALHHEVVMACAAQRKHLFCEKPVGGNSGQAYEMWSDYRETDCGHFVPFWARYIQVFARTKEIVAAGTLGQIKAIIYRWHNPRPSAMPFTWRDDVTLSSAGSIADVGSHAYDAVRWITGLEATRVLAHADVVTDAKPDLGAIDLTEALDWGESHAAHESQRSRRGTAYDYATIAWEFAGGAVGAIVLSHASFLRKGLAPELELHGHRRLFGVGSRRQYGDPGPIRRRCAHCREDRGARSRQSVCPTRLSGAEAACRGDFLSASGTGRWLASSDFHRRRCRIRPKRCLGAALRI